MPRLPTATWWHCCSQSVQSVFFTSIILPEFYFELHSIRKACIFFFILSFLLSVTNLSFYHFLSCFPVYFFSCFLLHSRPPYLCLFFYFLVFLFLFLLLYDLTFSAFSCFGRLLADLSLRRSRLDPRPVRMGFVVEKSGTMTGFSANIFVSLSELFHHCAILNLWPPASRNLIKWELLSIKHVNEVNILFLFFFYFCLIFLLLLHADLLVFCFSYFIPSRFLCNRIIVCVMQQFVERSLCNSQEPRRTACGLQTTLCLTSLCDPGDVCTQSSSGSKSLGKWSEVARKRRI